MIEADRLISSDERSEDAKMHVSVRPVCLDDYVGQDKVKSQLKVFIEAAKKRGDVLDHVLFFGPPGLGKTTLSHIIAHEMGGQLKQTSGPALDKSGDLAALLTHLQPGDVLFIDEIHRMSSAVEEVLYSAMEDYQLDIVIGEGPAARSIRIDLSPFTLVGATTRAGLLTAPLRDRFGIVQHLRFYTTEELTQIIMRSSQILGIAMLEVGAKAIAERSRGTPRIANRLLRRVRDFSQVSGQQAVGAKMAHEALEILEVDACGLDLLDRRLLELLTGQFQGRPVGLESLAASLGDERGTIEDMIEPYLIQQGFIARTARGRVALPKAYEHLGLEMPQD